MKKTLLLIFTALLAVLSLHAIDPYRSEIDGKYMYVYRNDRNAPDIIPYADFKGMEFKNLRDSIVGGFDTQVINTVDTIYNIPIGAIDSIAFHTQSNLYAEGVIVIEKPLSDYVYKSVDQKLYLSKSIPADLLPKTGQVLFTFGVEKVLPYGFAGRVVDITTSGDSLIYSCDEVDIGDVFDRYTGYICAPYAPDSDPIGLEPAMKPMASSSQYPYDPIIIEVDDDLFSNSFANLGIKLEEFDRTVLSKQGRNDINEKLEGASVGLGVNNLRIEIQITKFEENKPEFFYYKRGDIFRVEMSGELADYVKIIGDLSVEPTATTGVFKALSKSKLVKALRKNSFFKPFFSGLKKFNKYFFVDFDLYLACGVILGYETKCEQSIKYNLGFSLFDLFAGNRGKVLVKNLVQNHLDYDYNEFTKIHYLFGDAKVGMGLGLGMKLDFGNKKKDRATADKLANNTGEKGEEEEDPILRIKTGGSFSFGITGTVPIGLDEKTIDNRNLMVYRGLRNNPAVSLNASFEVYPFMIETALWDFKPWTYSPDDWNPYVRHNVPEFYSPVLDKNKMYSVCMNGKLLYPHAVGVAVYDEKTKEQEVSWYLKEVGYKDSDEWNRYDIDCTSLKPNRKYTIYPIMDQKLFWNIVPGTTDSWKTWLMTNAVPVLCDCPLDVSLESLPVTGGSALIAHIPAATLYGSVTGFKNLAFVNYEVGFEVWKVGDFSRKKVIAKNREEFSAIASGLAYDTEYFYRAYLHIEDDDIIYGETKTFKTEHTVFVDLGLSVMWCSRNLGAENESDAGYYYSWGADYSASEFTWDTYFDNPYDASGEWIGCSKVTTDITGTDRDIAMTYYAGSARMPSVDEMNELITKCTWEYTSLDQVNGYRVTGPNGNSIFLPCTGQCEGSGRSNVDVYGGYWTGSIAETNTSSARILYFYSTMMHALSQSNRFIGRPIRAVCEY